MSYKLSNVLLNLERFKYDNPGFSIISKNKMEILDEIVDYIFQIPDWSIMDQFEYDADTKRMILSGLKALRTPHWEEKTSVWKKFMSELLDDNLEATKYYSKSVSQRAIQIANQQQSYNSTDNAENIIDWLENEDDVDETFVSIEISPDEETAETLMKTAPKFGVKYLVENDKIFIQGPYEKVKYFIKSVYDSNFDFSDFYDKYEKEFKITNFEITSQELHDSGEYIEGEFNFSCDDDYTSGTFVYWKNDTATEIDELDFDCLVEYEKGGEFYNELINFVEDNVDTDLFEEEEEDENDNIIYKINDIVTNGVGKKAKILSIDEDNEEYTVNVFEADGAFQNYQDTWDFSETELLEDFYDKYEKEFKITNFEITSQELHDSGEYIEGEFNFSCDDDYTSGTFVYWKNDTATEIDELDFDCLVEYEKGGEFYNELINFVEDNVDTDLFDNQGDEETIQEFFENLPEEDEDSKPSNDSIIERFETASKFPNIKIEFYYPYDETISEFNIDNKKLAEAFNFLFNTEDFDGAGDDFSYLSEQIVNFNERKYEMTPIDFSDMMNNLAANIPGSDLENNEEMLYMNIPNSYTRFRISVSAMTHQWLEEFFLNN